MIDASELRIGNKFQRVGGTMIQTVFEIIDNTDRNKITFQTPEHKAKYHKLITCEENLNQYKPIEIEGIPLTPELLDRFGFGDDNKFMFNINRLVTICIHQNGNVYTLGNSEIKIQYVHQLQNLFWALCGKELEISEL